MSVGVNAGGRKRWVGGGLFAKVTIADGEIVKGGWLCRNARRWWYSTDGYLYLTNTRVIYTPHRFPMTPFEWRPSIIDYERIASCTLQKKFQFFPLNYFLPAIALEDTDGKHHWFLVAKDRPLEQIMKQIEELRNINQHSSTSTKELVL